MIVLDGGMGTLLQAAGLPAGKDPADWNIENPDAVLAVHRAYAAAGAQVISANTFGVNRLKYHGAYEIGRLVSAAVATARKVEATGPERIRVALDLGPTGRLLKPAGDLDPQAAYAAFAEAIRAGAAAGADLVFFETFGDTVELKAAVLAAKENCSLPIWASVALGEDGKLLTGASVEAVSVLLESLGVDAYGFNCGLGPDRMLPYVERLARISTKPILVEPNAGMPKLVDGQTVFSVGPEEFAGHVAKLVAAGATIVGGCCGTTPAHIEKVRGQRLEVEGQRLKVRGQRLKARDQRSEVEGQRSEAKISSGTTVVELKPRAGTIIGERINPTGKKLLKEAYLRGDVAYVLREAVKQTDAGAQILDVNCGVPGIDEAATLEATIAAVQSVATCPIQIDTADPAALERALRVVNGKALVNSVNGKRASMDAVFPLVKKYGGTIVALCLDESGIPATVEGRLNIARRILDEGAKYGFRKSDFVFDALTLAISSDETAALVTLETVRRLTEELGVNTVLGVSNVSFGLPNRPALNNAMYALAKRAGLSAAIANPSLIRDEIDPAAEAVLLGKDPHCAHWIAKESAASGVPPVSSEPAHSALRTPHSALRTLSDAIRHGLKDDARAAATAALSAGTAPMDVINTGIVPALEEVGRGFEKGAVYLPQLLMAADAAGEAFAVVKRTLGQRSKVKGQTKEDNHHCLTSDLGPRTSPRPIVLATVKGDIHDIGKNIVRALLENYGFDVIDLGRDVPPEKIVETVRKTGAKLVGLSALMTTTVGAMAETIRQLKAAGLDCRTVVGGAVVTQEYADSIGADFYAKDAMRTVRIAENMVK